MRALVRIETGMKHFLLQLTQSFVIHSVWDLYQEDMEEYREKKQSLRNRLIAAKAVVPPELLPKHDKGGDATDDFDPGMKAFLEMEKKLQGR